MFVAAGLCLSASLYYATRLPALRKLVHPIYARKGILPDLATALQAATDMTDPAEA